jgi:hypothetical protein
MAASVGSPHELVQAHLTIDCDLIAALPPTSARSYVTAVCIVRKLSHRGRDHCAPNIQVVGYVVERIVLDDNIEAITATHLRRLGTER